MIFAEESSLVESVFAGEISSFGDLVLLGIEDVAALTAGAILLASEDQNVVLGDGASAKPILNVCFEAAGPDFDKLPESRLLETCSVKSLNVSD